jgi:hypothetical protein
MKSRKRFLIILPALFRAALVALAVPARVAEAAAGTYTAPKLATPPPQAQSFHTSPGIGFDRLTSEDGLSQNTVTSILQDSRGFMWFGTEDGLNKYDGYSFTVYRHDPDDPYSLRDDSIMTLYEDRSGNGRAQPHAPDTCGEAVVHQRRVRAAGVWAAR